MDLNTVHHTFAKLEDLLHELGIETAYVEGVGGPQIGDTLRILLPVTEEGHPVLTEIMVTDFTDDLDLLHIYSTLIVRCNDRVDELSRKLSEWNILCPLGAYGVYEADGACQLFHKYTFPFDKTVSEAFAEQAMLLLELVHGVLSDQYPLFGEFAAR